MSTPKRNTLLNYFSKSDNKTPKSPKVTTHSATASAAASTALNSDADIRYKLYDLVWAKLEGFPWWPSIVCPHPTTNTHIKRKGKSVFIHVQFFDDPVSRAWIRLKDLKDYMGKHKSDVPLLRDLKWNQAIEFADQASKIEPDERWTLIAELRPSDDEEGIQLIDDDIVPQPNISPKSSVHKSPTIESKDNHKSELKRRNSYGDIETKDRKKFKRIKVESDEESKESDEDFKVGSSEDSEDSEDEKEVLEESESEISVAESDSELEQMVKSKRSSKAKKKSKNESNHKKKAKKTKRPKKSSYDSDETSHESDVYSSDSEPKKSMNKSSAKKKKKIKFQGSDSEELDISSGEEIKKKNDEKKDDKTEKKTNWLTQRSNSHRKTEKKSSNNSREGTNSKLNKSAVSVGDESFISAIEFSEPNDVKEWPHLKYEFLQPNKIKDKTGRFKLNKDGQLNPDYDATTLTVPESFLRECSPCQRQWWLIKADHFDTILFFKMGKFYELFHMDAVIAVSELQIAYMKGDCAHAGFPEKVYKRYADVLIQKGYKVARIEQTETPQMMEDRVKNSKKTSKYDKVVKREMCRVSTIGTRMASVIDVDMLTDGHSFLMAITENVNDNNSSEFGICFIDVSIGKFHLGQFVDNRYSSRLKTLLAHNPPDELLLERKNISPQTKQIFDNSVPNARKEFKKEFSTSKKTLKYLTENNSFGRDMPKVLVDMLDETDLLRQTPKPEYELAIRSFGAIVEYLKECLIDEEVISMNLMEEYKPCDMNNQENFKNSNLPSLMILDSFTIRNLEVFRNSCGGIEGTLTEVLDFCSTSFGKRLLHQWICSPLCDIQKIESRQTAVSELSDVNIRFEVEECVKSLKRLPDLERLLTKIHSQSSAKRAKEHPDSRAILFEIDVYTKRKISDFLSVLDGFKQAIKIVESFKKQSFNSQILIDCLSFTENGGLFPNYKEELKYFDNAFDHNRAKKEGKIIPQMGTDTEYDQQMDKIETIANELNKYLAGQRKFFGCNVSYFGTGKNRYQLEVPESAAKKITKDNRDYLLQSSRKGFKRYSTPFIQDKLEQLFAAEEAKDAVLQDIMRRVFETFDKHYRQWSQAIQCLSLLDVLISLSKSRSFLKQNGSPVCQPKFALADKPFVRLIESRNPCLLKYCQNFIPNDINIESELLLLTGPNMGGKSTLMRQLGLIVIMAQIGAHVPALECSLSPVDRVFTRIGAFDRIIEGESTFFVELSETALVLKHSSKHSLVLIDELGRGTSTFDGTAIACAVTKELSENIKCRTLFSSHYHSLVDEFRDNPSVKLVHMACAIENENETDPTEESITFLYKLKSDSCPKSYGFNAAQLAGIPKQVIRNAFKKAKEFERQNQIENTFRQIIENNVNDKQVLDIIPHLKSFCIDG